MKWNSIDKAWPADFAPRWSSMVSFAKCMHGGVAKDWHNVRYSRYRRHLLDNANEMAGSAATTSIKRMKCDEFFHIRNYLLSNESVVVFYE